MQKTVQNQSDKDKEEIQLHHKACEKKTAEDPINLIKGKKRSTGFDDESALDKAFNHIADQCTEAEKKTKEQKAGERKSSVIKHAVYAGD